MARAFEGVRVVEFAQVISGPLAAHWLGLLGADVVKVETPGEGDQGRRMMDGGPLTGQYMSPLYQGLNTGKRSLALNLKHPGAAQVVHRLVASADAVIENLRPGTMGRLGFGYEALRAVRPGLIYCSISGYGQAGPKALEPAYDGAIQAASGMMLINGTPGSGPLRVGFPVVDVATGMTAAFAVASALYRRAQTGEGQYLDVAMLDAALSLMSPVVNAYLIAGTPPGQPGNRSIAQQPTADVFPVPGGFLQLTALTRPQLAAFWSVLGHLEMLEDPRMATVEAQVANAEGIRAEITGWLGSATVDEWVARLNAAGVPCSRVLSLPEALVQPQLDHRDALAALERPGEADGLARVVVNAGFRAGLDGPRASAPPPAVGEDSTAVLAELGFTPAEITALRDGGVV